MCKNTDRQVLLFIKELIRGLADIDKFLSTLTPLNNKESIAYLTKIYSKIFEADDCTSFINFEIKLVARSTVALGLKPTNPHDSNLFLYLNLKDGIIKEYDESYDNNISYILELYIHIFNCSLNISLQGVGYKNKIKKFQLVIDQITNVFNDFIEDVEIKGRPIREEAIELKLPKFLDDFIFLQCNAKYNVDHVAVTQNVDNDTNKNLNYLGTYFPRSYSESYIILNDLLSSKIIREAFNQKETVRVLSIGSGTGADIFGVLHALIDNKLVRDKIIYIDSYEGNSDALSTQKKITELFNKEFLLDIKLNGYEKRFTTTNIFNEIVDAKKTYDIIITFKFINELYRNQPQVSGLYRNYIQMASIQLNQDGICIIGEVCDSGGCNNFLPIIVANEIRDELKCNSSIKHILPKSCALWADKCSEDCFTGAIFRVKHTNNLEGKDNKLSFRVFAKEEFANSIIAEYNSDISYKISHATKNPICSNGIRIKYDTNQNGLFLNE